MTAQMQVGFLGLGQMGAPIAERLLGREWQLHVFDPRPNAVKDFVARGAVTHESAIAVANIASVVLACLPSQAVSLDAALGPKGVRLGRAIKIYAEMSTVGAETLGEIARGLSPEGIQTIDSPITGGPAAARAGGLTVMVAGSPDARTAVQPLLASIGKTVIVIGDQPGMAQMMKVINNVIMATNMVAACEGLSIGVRAGLDVATMLDVLRNGTGQSFAGCEILRSAVSGAFDFGAKLSIVRKDVALGVHESASVQARTPVIDQAGAVWAQASGADQDEDFTAIMKIVEQANGVVVRTREGGGPAAQRPRQVPG